MLTRLIMVRAVFKHILWSPCANNISLGHISVIHSDTEWIYSLVDLATCFDITVHAGEIYSAFITQCRGEITVDYLEDELWTTVLWTQNSCRKVIQILWTHSLLCWTQSKRNCWFHQDGAKDNTANTTAPFFAGLLRWPHCRAWTLATTITGLHHTWLLSVDIFLRKGSLTSAVVTQCVP